jgi:hypothetical protein
MSLVIVQAGINLLVTAPAPGTTGLAGLRAEAAALAAFDVDDDDDVNEAAFWLFSSCLASSCRRVLTTICFLPDQLEALLFSADRCHIRDSPQIGLVAVLVTIPAIAAAPRWMYGLDSAPAAAVAPLCVTGTKPE